MIVEYYCSTCDVCRKDCSLSSAQVDWNPFGFPAQVIKALLGALMLYNIVPLHSLQCDTCGWGEVDVSTKLEDQTNHCH
jgi:hypothetical protein